MESDFNWCYMDFYEARVRTGHGVDQGKAFISPSFALRLREFALNQVRHPKALKCERELHSGKLRSLRQPKVLKAYRYYG